MDPLTASLTLANTIAQIILLAMQRETAEEQKKMAEMRMRWLDVLMRMIDTFAKKETPQAGVVK